MIEVLAQYIPEVVITVLGTIVWFSVKRYLNGQDKRYSALAADFKEFSENLIKSLNSLIVQQATDVEKHANTAKHLKRIDNDIDTLYDRTNESIKKLVKIESKVGVKTK